jgi:hypothetical protein
VPLLPHFLTIDFSNPRFVRFPMEDNKRLVTGISRSDGSKNGPSVIEGEPTIWRCRKARGQIDRRSGQSSRSGIQRVASRAGDGCVKASQPLLMLALAVQTFLTEPYQAGAGTESRDDARLGTSDP